MFQQQKKRLLNQYAKSPRCVNSYQRYPVNKPYSWKNYLNSDINAMYKKLQNQNISQQKDSINQQLKYARQNQSLIIKDSPLKLKSQCGIQTQNNLYLYQKVQTGTNTPYKHRHSNSVTTGQSSLKAHKISAKITSQFNFHYYGQKQQNQSINQKINDQSFFKKEKSIKQQQQMQNFVASQPRQKKILIDKQYKKISNDLDLYHLQLKQRQRQYLLQKFIQHYQKIHSKKF